ncbi:MAG: TerC family protein [Cyanobacteriota bacterium]
MEAESMPSLTPLIEGADQWGEMVLLLPLLVALECVLSADNAIALAAIARQLHDPARQRQALNFGLLFALVLRLALIVAARWVLAFWPLQLLAALYLLWLAGRQLLPSLKAVLGFQAPAEIAETAGAGSLAANLDPKLAPRASPSPGAKSPGAKSPGAESGLAATAASAPPANAGATGASLAAVVATLAFTDLAFSLDSVAAAVAVTDRLPLVIAGGVIGVIALRLTAELFIRWLDVYRHLENAGYLAVALVGLRLLLRLVYPDVELPEWSLLVAVGALFAWGFSSRLPEAVPASDPEP